MKKFLFIFVLILEVNAAPVTFNNEDNGGGLASTLESLIAMCHYYTNIFHDNKTIKSKCNIYERDVSQAFELGYRIDRQSGITAPVKTEDTNDTNISTGAETIDFHGRKFTCNPTRKTTTEHQVNKETDNEKEKMRYLEMLKKANKKHNAIMEIIQHEIVAARQNKDARYHEKLIRPWGIHLCDCDYVMMKKYETIYKNAKNPRYISAIQSIEQERRIQQIEKEMIGREKENERNRKILQALQMQKERARVAEAERKKAKRIAARNAKWQEKMADLAKQCGGEMTDYSIKGYISGSVTLVQKDTCIFVVNTSKKAYHVCGYNEPLINGVWIDRLYVLRGKGKSSFQTSSGNRIVSRTPGINTVFNSHCQDLYEHMKF